MSRLREIMKDLDDLEMEKAADKEKKELQLSMIYEDLDKLVYRFIISESTVESSFIENRPVKVINYLSGDVRYFIEYYPEFPHPNPLLLSYSADVTITRCWNEKSFSVYLNEREIKEFLTALEDRFGVMIR